MSRVHVSVRSSLLPLTWVLLVLAIGASPRVAKAHDYWLSATPSTPQADEEITLRMWVGEAMKAQAERPFAPDRTVRFVHASSGGDVVDVDAEEGVPVWSGRLEGGGHLFGMHRGPAFIELPGAEFERYLSHEALTSVIDARRERGESAMPGKERYQRYLKLWLPVGEATGSTHGLDLGFAYELVLLDPPSAGDVRVEARFRGAPLVGAPLTLVRGDAVARAPQRTDERGQILLSDLSPGTWLVRGVHMVRSEQAGVDWDSFWAAFTFEVPSRDVVAPAPSPAPPQPVAPGGGCAGCGLHPTRPSNGLGAWLVTLLALWVRRTGTRPCPGRATS